MKRLVTILCCLLLALHLALPAGALIASKLDCAITLDHMGLPILTAAVSAVLGILSFFIDNPAGGKAAKVLFFLLAPLSVINGIFCIYIGGSYALLWMLIAIGGSLIPAARYIGDNSLRMTILIMAVVLLIPMTLLSLFQLLFGGFAKNTVVKTLASPNGAYNAQVIASDHGATGGDTIVNVKESKEYDFYFFRLYKEPKQVWFGDWGAYVDMEIAWKNDTCLIINGEEHTIP